MLKYKYNFNVYKQNFKFIKLNFLILNIFLIHIVSLNNVYLTFKKTKQLKTLLQSPFHYKVAKKNIVNLNYKISITINIPLTRHINPKLIIFKYWYYLNWNSWVNNSNYVQLTVSK